MKNANKIISEIRTNPELYDYIEVMACPGGCIGGGGQPIPTTMKIVKERIKSLYNIDSSMELRKAHQNPVVRDFFDNYIKNLPEEQIKSILETNYSHKHKYE
jgi:iron only hydrogenase large subunit-like protein